jgi:hypothetical protein
METQREGLSQLNPRVLVRISIKAGIEQTTDRFGLPHRHRGEWRAVEVDCGRYAWVWRFRQQR